MENSSKNSLIKVSPSQIGNLLECPRCLWLYFRENLKRPEGVFPSLPNGMDNVFKRYFDEYRKLGKLPPEIAKEVEGSLFQNEEKLRAWRSPWEGLRAEFLEFNILLRGAIDELLVSKEGKYIPFDFKTRGYPSKEDTHKHYQTQLDLYALLFEKNNLPPADFGYLLFFWPKTYENQNVEFVSKLVKMEVSPERGYQVLKKVNEIVKGPIPSSHKDCDYCKYRRFEINE